MACRFSFSWLSKITLHRQGRTKWLVKPRILQQVAIKFVVNVEFMLEIPVLIVRLRCERLRCHSHFWETLDKISFALHVKVLEKGVSYAKILLVNWDVRPIVNRTQNFLDNIIVQIVRIRRDSIFIARNVSILGTIVKTSNSFVYNVVNCKRRRTMVIPCVICLTSRRGLSISWLKWEASNVFARGSRKSFAICRCLTSR